MSKFQKLLSVILFALLVSIVAGRFSGLYSRNTKDVYSEVRQNIYIFGQLYKVIQEIGIRYHPDENKDTVTGVVFFLVGFNIFEPDRLHLTLALDSSCNSAVHHYLFLKYLG